MFHLAHFRFLEEWSGRFKRQNEEVLRLVDKTLSKFNITTLLIHNQVVSFVSLWMVVCSYFFVQTVTMQKT